jgi:putative FmdB family regulatory protein
MPLREYVCRDCEYIFEELIRNPEEEPRTCPRCEQGAVERLVSAHGGYFGNMGGGSVRPKNAGSFKRGKP